MVVVVVAVAAGVADEAVEVVAAVVSHPLINPAVLLNVQDADFRPRLDWEQHCSSSQ